MESPNSIESIGITSKGTNGLADEISLKSARIFEKAGLTVHLIAPLRNKQFLTLDSLADLARAQIDLVAVVGGDGTILKTARQIKGRIPIVGINVGGRGILAEISPSEVDKATRMIKDRQFQIQKRTRIFARTESESYPPVLNEVYVDKVRRIRTPRFSISTPDLVQNGYELKLRMDGVISASMPPPPTFILTILVRPRTLQYSTSEPSTIFSLSFSSSGGGTSNVSKVSKSIS